MKIFGKNREVLRIKRATAARVVYDHQQAVSIIELRLITEDGQRLSLEIPPQLAGKLTMEIGSAYEAISPPLTRGGHWADQQGMWDA